MSESSNTRVRGAPMRHCARPLQGNRGLVGWAKALATATLLALAQFAPAANFTHYDFTGFRAAPFYSALGDNPSINSHGAIAFIGTNASTTLENPWVLTFTAFTQLGTTAEEVYGRPAQINNASETVIRDRRSGAPPPTRVRVFDLSNPTAGINIEINTPPIDTLFSHPSINNLGEVVYTGLTSGARFMSNGVNSVSIAATSPRPMIADTGQVILNDNGTIKLYSSTLGAPVTIASAAGGFTTLGNAAGISDSGKVVAFSGDKGSGTGVFAAIDTGSGFALLPMAVAGGGAPVSPTLIDTPDLGFDDNGNALFFSSIDTTNRVGVAHWEGGAPGIVGDSFVVAFIGTPSGQSVQGVRKKFVPGMFFTNQPGLFTRRVDIISVSPLVVRRHLALPVAQVGSAFNLGGTFTVQSIALHDPISEAEFDAAGQPLARPFGSHYLTFWVSNGSEHAIFRAAHLNPCIVPVVRLGQAEAPWDNDAYGGHPQIEIGEIGCALSAITQAANRTAVQYGINNSIDPGQMNTLLDAGGGYGGTNRLSPPETTPRGKSVRWTTAVQLLRRPGKLLANTGGAVPRFEAVSLSTRKPAEAQAARDYVTTSLCDPTNPTPVVLASDFHTDRFGRTTPHHFVVASGVVNGKILIADVGYRTPQTMDFNGGANGPIYNNQFDLRGKIVDPVDVSAFTIDADDRVDILVTNGVGQRTGIDPATGNEVQEIPGAVIFQDGLLNLTTKQSAGVTQSVIIQQPGAAQQFTVSVKGKETGPFQLRIGGVDVNGNDAPQIVIADQITVGASKVYAVNLNSTPGGVVQLVTTTVPTVTSLTQSGATAALTNVGLVVGTVTSQASASVPAGNVISQNPLPGLQVAAGSAVNLVVSTGAGGVSVPNVVGQTQAAATTTITNAGLVVGTITQQVSATVPAGNVISQNPAAGASVASGSAVALVISTGPGGFAAGTTFVASASNAAPTAITTLAVQCPASGLLVVTGSGESAAKSNFAGNAFIGLAYSIARDSTATDNGNVVQSSALAKFNGDANRDFLNVQRVDACTPGANHTYTLTAYATTPQTSITSGSFVWNGRLVASGGPASSSFAAGTTFVGSASNASPTILTTLPVQCPASGMVAVTGSGESAAKSNFAGNAFMGLAYSISRDSVATDNGNVVQSSALAIFNGDANRDFLNVQRVDSCSPGVTNTYRLTAYATTPQTGIASQSFVFNGRLTATALPVVTGTAPGTTFMASASNAAPTVVTSLNIVCPASGKAVVTGSGESAAQSTLAGSAFIGLAYSIARDSTATDNGNVVQSSALAVFNGDANRDFLNVQRADTCTPGQPHTYFLTAYATTPQTGIANGSFVWNGRLVAILPP